MTKKVLERLENKAKNLAMTSGFRTQHVAFIVKRNKIIVSGVNIRKTDAFAFRCGFDWGFAHAESVCLKKLQNIDLESKGFVIISIRVARKPTEASLTLARPCPVCRSLIMSAGIEKIYYSTNNGSFNYEKLS